MQISISELNLKSECEILAQVDDYVYDLALSEQLEDAVGLPILRETLFTNVLPYVLVVEVDDVFADPTLCENMRAYIVQIE